MTPMIDICLFVFLLQTPDAGVSRIDDKEMQQRIVKTVDCFISEEEVKKALLEKKGENNFTRSVSIEVVVDKAGKVESAKLVRGNPIQEKAAIECVKQWVFRAVGQRYKGNVIVIFKPKVSKATSIHFDLQPRLTLHGARDGLANMRIRPQSPVSPS
ncbi:MAG: energy transducer TonB [Acidobacteriia bacterium]|nr:energy transducer TonB [Terriglobia bacterium]